MARSKGSANLSASLEVLAGAPLDAREVVQTKADLTAEGSFPYKYIGLEVYVVAENKKYRLIGNDPTSLANWQEVGAGGGSGNANAVELTQAEYDALTEEEKNNGTIYFITNAPNGNDIQLPVMPTASYSYANMIVQYVGETTQTYTNGYFYKCEEDGGNYSWNPCPTQEGGSGGTTDYEDLDNRPSIEDVTLSGNKTASDLGLQKSTLANAVTLGGNEVTNLESALSILARLATISKITDNSLGGNSSTNFNTVEYSSTGNFKAYSYKWGAGSALAYTTGVPQWFTYPSYDVNYLFLTFRGTDDTFIDEFAWCFYTESSVAKVKHYARRATKSGSTWTFPAWTEVGSLPVATSSVLGGVKIGENMTIEDGVINPSYLVVANKFNKADLYSTTEKVVGCWTDGRPIYQKTFQPSMPQCVTNGTGVSGNFSIGATVNEIINISIKFRSGSGYDMTAESFVEGGICVISSTATPQTLPYKGVRCYGAPNNISTSSDRNKIFLVNSSTDMNPYTPVVTVQYTKTTDSANSFKYADENDYSTTEKIVGTWIDGSLIYQKTISIGSLATSGEHAVNHNISGMKNVISVQGIALNGSGVGIPIPEVGFGSSLSIESFKRVVVTSTQVKVTHSNTLSGYTAYVTIKYTK